MTPVDGRMEQQSDGDRRSERACPSALSHAKEPRFIVKTKTEPARNGNRNNRPLSSQAARRQNGAEKKCRTDMLHYIYLRQHTLNQTSHLSVAHM